MQKPRVVAISTAGYPTPARRPAYGVLATKCFEATFGFGLPEWREALARCVASAAEPTVR
jgi:dTDP-4-dehydrorhamnose reductase